MWHLSKIPKIAHFYWGNKVLPYLRYLTLYSFKKYNPDWVVNLYIPKFLQPEMSWNGREHKFPIDCKDYYGQINALTQQFNKLELELIEKYGKDSVINIQTGEVKKK